MLREKFSFHHRHHCMYKASFGVSELSFRKIKLTVCYPLVNKWKRKPMDAVLIQKQVDISMYWPLQDCKEHGGQSPLIVTIQKISSGDCDVSSIKSLAISILISIHFKLEYRNKFHLGTLLQSPTSQECLVVFRICRENIPFSNRTLGQEYQWPLKKNWIWRRDEFLPFWI